MSELTLYIPQRKEKGKASQVPKAKANWDSKNKEIFIRLCVEQVKNGNRPDTHLNKEGLEVVKDKFASATGRSHNRKQLKNHWDVLKKEWGIWNSLLRGESGLGRDPVTGAITADEEWWKNKLQRYTDAARFKEKPLPFVNELDIMFSDVAATGEWAYTPSSGQIPFTNNIVSEEHETDDGDDETPSENQPVKVIHPSELGKKRTQECNLEKRKSKKQSVSNNLVRTLNRIVDAVEASSTKKSASVNTMAECLEKLKNLPGVSENDEFYVWGVRLLVRDRYREMFMALSSDELRFRWLSLEITLEKSRIPGHLEPY